MYVESSLNFHDFVLDVYNVTSRKGSLGKFCLFKPTYRIGEEIVGNFDFTDSVVPCVKVSHFPNMHPVVTPHNNCIVGLESSRRLMTKTKHN